MELIANALLALNLGGLAVAALLFRGHLTSYVSEKGKNLASKEDLFHLTQIVEGIKALHTSELEHIKAGLLAEGQVTERRRRVYEEICLALRVFISGHGGATEMKERFHAAYAAAWLWASDDVLIALNHFIELKVKNFADPTSIDQISLKCAYASVILEMRRDTGFGDTSVSGSNYQFVKF